MIIMKTHEYIPIWDAAGRGNRTLSPRVVQGSTFCTLIWDPVDGASTYRILSISETGEMSTIVDGITDNRYNITGLMTDQTYTFLIQYYDGSSYSSADPINYIRYTPGGRNDVLPPFPVATPGNASITLSWDAIEGATKYGISLVEGEDFTEVNYNIRDTSYTVTDLINGQSYTFLVQAYDPNMSHKWSSIDSALFITATPHA